MAFRRFIALAVALLVLGGGWPAGASETGTAHSAMGQAQTSDVFDPATALAFSQAAIGRQVGDYEFLDQDRRAVRLADYRGRPLIISLIFTSCKHTCPLITQHLSAAIESAQEAFGKDSFSAVSVGFDPIADTPERMHDYVEAQGIDVPNWRFLSGDNATLDALIEDLGFIRVESSRGFDHLAQVSVIDSSGKVSHQVYGDTFNVTAVVDPLKAIMFNDTSRVFDVSDIIQRVRLFCTYYDPKMDRYKFDYSIFISIAVGLMTLIGLGYVLVSSWLRARKTPVGPV